jgi:hypothetical protein
MAGSFWRLLIKQRINRENYPFIKIPKKPGQGKGKITAADAAENGPNQGAVWFPPVSVLSESAAASFVSICSAVYHGVPYALLYTGRSGLRVTPFRAP